jgi:hypothetical protein
LANARSPQRLEISPVFAPSLPTRAGAAARLCRRAVDPPPPRLLSTDSSAPPRCTEPAPPLPAPRLRKVDSAPRLPPLASAPPATMSSSSLLSTWRTLGVRRNSCKVCASTDAPTYFARFFVYN